MYRRGPSLLGIIYIVIGVFVAIDHRYLKNIDNLEQVVSAALAIILWPLVLLDVNLRVNF
jgi:ABC-type anion transport system duplicated permease subunit